MAPRTNKRDAATIRRRLSRALDCLAQAEEMLIEREDGDITLTTVKVKAAQSLLREVFGLQRWKIPVIASKPLP